MNVRMENLSFEVYFWGNNRILTCEYNSYVENPAFIWSATRAFNECFPQKEISLIEYQQIIVKFSLRSICCFFHQSLSVHIGVNNYYKVKKIKEKYKLSRSGEMGGSESAPKKEEQKVKINHPKFKQVRLIEQEDILRNTLPIQHDADFQIWQQKLSKVIKIEDEIILLPKAYQYTRKAICGTAGIIQIDYDNYQYVLIDELKNRRKVKHYFEELQLWYLVYSLVSASHHFRSINSKIGDVRPQNIFINEQGHVKVANIYSWPAENTNYSKTVIDSQKTYLSPEELISAKQGSSEDFIDVFKAESFSIGLTLLQSAILHDMGPLYLPTKQLDYRKLDKFLTEWWGLKFNVFDQKSEQNIAKQYSDALKISIAAMCEIESRQRLSSQELYNWLKPFHNKIIDIKPFEPGVPPVKNLQIYRNRLKRQKEQIYQNKLHLPRQKLIQLRSNEGLSAKTLTDLSQHDRYRKFDGNVRPHAMPIYLHHQNIFNLAQTQINSHETSNNPPKINPLHFPHPFALPLMTNASGVRNPTLATLRTRNNRG